MWVHVAVLKIKKSLSDPFFTAFALNSRGSYEQSQLYTRGATNQDLGLTRMAKILVALPPLEEQRKIRAHLEHSFQDLDTHIELARRSISLLIERRSALISAAVNGQLDVRGLAPEEAIA